MDPTGTAAPAYPRKSTWRFTTLRSHRRRTSLLKDEDLLIQTPTEQPKRRLEALRSGGSWTQPESKLSSMIPRSTTATRSSDQVFVDCIDTHANTEQRHDRTIPRNPTKQTPSDPPAATVCLFQARLDKFWMHQVVKYDFTADLTGIGDRSVHSISVL